jgi:hypothetical protein
MITGKYSSTANLEYLEWEKYPETMILLVKKHPLVTQMEHLDDEIHLPFFSHTDPNLIALDPCGYQVEKVVETSKPLFGTYLSSLLSCIYTLYLV